MRDATHYGGKLPDVPAHKGAEWAPRLQWLADAPLEVAMMAPTADGEDVTVTANHGRWIVACPDCLGAQLACATDHRFMCNECGNIAIDGLWRKTVWPKSAKAIAAELDRRPKAANRNWTPGETVALLRAEADLMLGSGL